MYFIVAETHKRGEVMFVVSYRQFMEEKCKKVDAFRIDLVIRDRKCWEGIVGKILNKGSSKCY